MLCFQRRSPLYTLVVISDYLSYSLTPRPRSLEICFPFQAILYMIVLENHVSRSAVLEIPAHLATFSITSITFRSHSEACFELQPVVFSMSTCLIALSSCHRRQLEKRRQCGSAWKPASEDNQPVTAVTAKENYSHTEVCWVHCLSDLFWVILKKVCFKTEDNPLQSTPAALWLADSIFLLKTSWTGVLTSVWVSCYSLVLLWDTRILSWQLDKVFKPTPATSI